MHTSEKSKVVNFSFAYIEFADPESVQTAMALDESLFRGRQIKVGARSPDDCSTRCPLVLSLSCSLSLVGATSSIRCQCN